MIFDWRVSRYYFQKIFVKPDYLSDCDFEIWIFQTWKIGILKQLLSEQVETAWKIIKFILDRIEEPFRIRKDSKIRERKIIQKMFHLQETFSRNNSKIENSESFFSEDILFNFLQSISLPTVQIIRIRLKQ